MAPAETAELRKLVHEALVKGAEGRDVFFQIKIMFLVFFFALLGVFVFFVLLVCWCVCFLTFYTGFFRDYCPQQVLKKSHHYGVRNATEVLFPFLLVEMSLAGCQLSSFFFWQATCNMRRWEDVPNEQIWFG